MRKGSAATATLRGGASYFLIVFGAGFVLGVPRALWLVPVLGERWAELAEMPVMLLVIHAAARWVSRRFSLAAYSHSVPIGVGLAALSLLLLAELGVVLPLRGLSLAEYIEARDPLSGSVYLASLLLFAVMPALVARRSG